MARFRRKYRRLLLLGLLLLGAITSCSYRSDGLVGHGTESAPLGASVATPEQSSPYSPPEIPQPAEDSAWPSSAPCSGSSDISCAPRDVSHFGFSASIPEGAGFAQDLSADSLEDVLEKGLRLNEASPVHFAVRGTTVGGSVRCAWRGVARTAAQREIAVRYWLNLSATDTLPTAAEVERRFMAVLDGASHLVHPETEKANFKALARGGLTTDYVFLACYADYTASEYILGAGPTTLTVAYDHLAEARSYDLYNRAHTAGEFGSEALLTESAYEAVLDQTVWDAESALSSVVEGRESVVFLAPMGAYHAIAIEAWRVIEQWDVQTVNGTVNAVRYGTDSGDPEYSQTLANLQSRITTAATSDAFANNRIADVSGLQAYYTTIGAYEDITPDDGQTTTFMPAQPLPMRPCANGTAVPNPRDNRMLVQCDAA